ncbi:AMP-dependent synthetase/ligase [Actinokineospora globicatena]|uniref:AMP-dependent synthetase/ligase n=1 Tax=Actinokineospora globicatena TaxID=103729 RepID=UPI0024A1A252|nr:AMP-dependent synthetase/ligase [Actinokineospora globicatena]MCP2305470.1 Long-chain acyl-CoA synthetase (AMP-forming) [Actinokineospora globicatena]GLW81338.1 putative fatty-acid-CoA ligase FadD [Actinokineospora globicatena]GLW87964.1 putative fatty-acid-CoA ligase FadD [Actinokineospora globicatena]
MDEYPTLCAAFQDTAQINPAQVALRTPGGVVSVSWREYDQRVRTIAAGLAALGVTRGEAVGLMLTNRPEFHLVDTAVLHLGALPFSVYNTSAPEQLAHVFANAGNRIVVTERSFVPLLRAAAPDLRLVCVDGAVDGAESLAEVEAGGSPDFDFDAAWRAVEPDDVATIIYTSGTTGPPKGVELTHANVMAVAQAVKQAFELLPGDRVVSFLPSAHIADRVASHYASILFGTEVISVADPRDLATALPDARPHLFFAVPRVWQKLQLGIQAAVAAEPSGLKRAIATWALDVGLRHLRRPRSWYLTGCHAVADRLVLRRLRARLGLAEVKVPASGAAAIPVETLEFFWAIGIPVYEIWGMSETAGLGTSGRVGLNKLGTVGTPVHGTEVRLADDGELLIRGASVMSRYRNDPIRTAATIDPDGWVHTGDIGVIDEDGFVSIVDRKKELIITSSGKNMSPTAIENAIKAANPVISQVVAIGDNRPYVSALVVLDQDAMTALAAAHNLPATPSALAASTPVRTLVTAAIRAGNQKLSRTEQVKRFHILPTYWPPGGDELTPTLKLRRKPIAEKYAQAITNLYAETPTPDTVNLATAP